MKPEGKMRAGHARGTGWAEDVNLRPFPARQSGKLSGGEGGEQRLPAGIHQAGVPSFLPGQRPRMKDYRPTAALPTIRCQVRPDRRAGNSGRKQVRRGPHHARPADPAGASGRMRQHAPSFDTKRPLDPGNAVSVDGRAAIFRGFERLNDQRL